MIVVICTTLLDEISLFNVLRAPLDQLADMVTNVLQSKVSLDRVEKFLNEEETQKYHILKRETGIVGPEVGFTDATFSWAVARSDDESEAPYDIVHNVLYSVNSYSQNAHTNFVLSKSGEIVAESLRNNGEVYATEVVGSYWHDMTPTGQEHNVVYDGVNVIQKEMNKRVRVG